MTLDLSNIQLYAGIATVVIAFLGKTLAVFKYAANLQNLIEHQLAANKEQIEFNKLIRGTFEEQLAFNKYTKVDLDNLQKLIEYQLTTNKEQVEFNKLIQGNFEEQKSFNKDMKLTLETFEKALSAINEIITVNHHNYESRLQNIEKSLDKKK